MNKELTIVVPNRDRINLDSFVSKMFLGSLENQSYNDFELIIVDGGSKNVNQVKQFVENSNLKSKKFILHELGQTWEKCLLNNIGIRNANGKYVMTTDADMLFGKNFIKTVIENLRKGADIFVESRSMYLKTGVMNLIYDKKLDFYNNEKSCMLGKIKKRSTCGGCQATSKTNWEKLHGYNEKMLGWGSEDQELMKRASIMGLRIIWLGEKDDIMLYHQAHNKISPKEDLEFQYKNLPILNSCNSFMANPDSWGGIKTNE